MTTPWDAIVVGAGLDGLVAAALLARAGRRVLVLEAAEKVGGTVATDDLGRGCRAPAVFAGLELLHPAIVSDLGLAAHGYEALPRAGGTLVPLGGGDCLRLDPSDGLESSLARFSTSDAASLAALEGFRGRLSGALERLFAERLPPPRPGGLRDAIHLFGLARRLRGLGAREMEEALRFLPMSVRDVLDERLETEPLKAALAAPALYGSWLGPRSPGSALGLLHHRPAWVGHVLSPPLQARGGPGALTAAVASAARAAGAEIRTGAVVASLLLSPDGSVAGVVGGAGDEHRAKAVLSSLDPKRTLLELYDARRLDPELAAAIRAVRGRGSVAIVRLVLDRRPRFAGAPEDGDWMRGRIQIGASQDELERAFDRAKHGLAPERPWLEATLPSVADASLAPEGREVMHVWVQHAAHDLREGSWDEEGDRLGETVVARIEEHAPGFAQSVLALDVQTPVDLERRFGLTQGCLYQAELALDQWLYMRPIPGWYDYATPVRGLYLCGAATHGGGGPTGLAGRGAALRVLEEAA